MPRPVAPEVTRPPRLNEDDASGVPGPGAPRRSRSSRRALAWLRTALYLTPGPAFFMTIHTIRNLPTSGSGFVSIGGIVGTIAGIGGVGIFDGMLSGTVAKRDNKPVPRALILHVVTFVMIQMIFGLVLVAGALVIWMF